MKGTNLGNFWVYLSKDKIAMAILSFMLIILILNLFKTCYVFLYRKKESNNRSCRFLKNGEKGLVCSHNSHVTKFTEKDNSCEGCFGRTAEMSIEEAEERAKRCNRIVFILFVVAVSGKNMLPYLSILFTLFSAMTLSAPSTP